jgi:hypothetical protein
MPRLVRKQVYIEARQEQALKRRARARGVTEAALIRDALDRDERAGSASFAPDPLAWREFQAFLQKLRRRAPKPRAARRWTRDDLYAERTERRGRHAD